MLASSAPTQISTPFANSGTKNIIPVASQIGITPGAASYTDGFPPLTMTPVASGGVPPFGADFNGVLNAITLIQQWQSAGGVYPFNSTFATAIGGYPKGAILEKASGTGYWVNQADNNTVNPDTVGTNWIDLGGVIGQYTAIQGAFKNLALSASGASAVLNISADAVTVRSSAGIYATLTGVSLTPSTGGATGANSLDTGAWAYSTWYNTYVIYNPTTTTVAALFSLSATAPTLPSGYTMFARVGAFRTPSATNYYPLAFKQYGRRAQWAVASGSNVPTPPSIASGSSGNPATPTWTGVAWSSIAPPTAASVKLYLYNPTTGTESQAAPNNSYGAYGSTTNPPPLSSGNSSSATMYISSIADLIPESANFYYASNGARAGLYGLGWEDNL